jgi:hypothetical protein
MQDTRRNILKTVVVAGEGISDITAEDSYAVAPHRLQGKPRRGEARRSSHCCSCATLWHVAGEHRIRNGRYLKSLVAIYSTTRAGASLSRPTFDRSNPYSDSCGGCRKALSHRCSQTVRMSESLLYAAGVIFSFVRRPPCPAARDRCRLRKRGGGPCTAARIEPVSISCPIPATAPRDLSLCANGKGVQNDCDKLGSALAAFCRHSPAPLRQRRPSVLARFWAGVPISPPVEQLPRIECNRYRAPDLCSGTTCSATARPAPLFFVAASAES